MASTILTTRTRIGAGPRSLRTTSRPRTRLRAAPRGLPVGTGAMGAAVVFQTLANLLFHGVAGRALGPSSYGALGTLLGLAVMVTVPLGSLQAAVNRATALQPGSDPGRVLRQVGAAGAGLALVLAVAAVPIQGFLHLPSLTLTLLLAPYLLQATVLAAGRGVLLGQGRAGAVAATMAGATVLRLAGGVALTGRFGVEGAMVATVGSEVLGLLVVLALIARRTGRQHGPALQVTGSDLGTSGLTVVGLWLFTSVDLLLARHHLSGGAAGGYVAAATLARCILAIPAAVVAVAVPRFAASSLGEAGATLKRVLFAVAGVGLAGALPLVAFPGPVQEVLFGRPLAPAALVRALALVAVLSSLATAGTYFNLARGHREALIPWLGALLEIALISANHDTVGQVATGSALATLPTLALLGLLVRRRLLAGDTVDPPRHQPDPEPLFDVATAPLWAEEASVDLSVVLPFFNPGESVGRTIARTVEVLRAEGVSFEVIAVSDGSTDGSERHVPFDVPEVRLIVQPRNQGKGSAVQVGLAASHGAVCGFIDADGDIDPVHLVGYLRELREGGHDIVFASKRHPSSATESSAGRRVISLGYSTLVSSLFRLGVSDTQTGAKLLRRDVAAAIVPWARERRFAFDLELFVLARTFGFTRLHPAPVHLGERLAGSTVTRSAVVRTLRDTVTIWSRLHLARAYPSPAAAAAAPVVELRPRAIHEEQQVEASLQAA